MAVADAGLLAGAVLWLVVPGLLVVAAAGFRSWTLAVSAPLVTYGIVAVSSSVLSPVPRYKVAER